MILTAGLVLYTAISVSRRSGEPKPVAAETPTSGGGAGTLTKDVQVDATTGGAGTVRCLVIGLGAGVLSGFLGVGGGILMTPTFRGWLRLGLKETVATSLACVGLIAIPCRSRTSSEGDGHWLFAGSAVHRRDPRRDASARTGRSPRATASSASPSAGASALSASGTASPRSSRW